MFTSQWERVKLLLHQAMQLDPEQRPQFLSDVCSSDTALRAELESLLAANEDVGSNFLLSPAVDVPSDPNHRVTQLQAGQIFEARFHLIRKLGEGGMGQVWLAEQITPVRRQVALKLIKAGMYDESVVQRFLAERQSLAIMDHPTIAKVFDAGTTPLGQPYFVMEYVPGLPITDYCDRKKLRIGERLELFVPVCEGVQHAHQKAVIHRDLKPANILVVEVDGKAVPRIIDFGLAKATTPQPDGASLFTQMGHFVGTPGYMSPEQVDPNVRDVDTRSDVYSLGAVLYVLLAGSQLFGTKPEEKLPLDELLMRLRKEDPPTPSARVSSDRVTSIATAEARSTDARQLASELRGDLDRITMKALEKDRARRYGSPSELAADIRRYLNHEAISARPATFSYRLQKYVRRHRIAVGVVAGLALLLAAFIAVQAVQLRRITHERDRATRITDFMTGMFKVSDPSVARGNSVTAREILDKASGEISKTLAKDPYVQAQMMQVMAKTYSNLGLYQRAHELAQGALDIRVRGLGPNDPASLESMALLGVILSQEGHYSDAEKLQRQALAGERRVLGPENAASLATMDSLATTLGLEGHRDEQNALIRQVISIETRVLGPENPQTLQSMHGLGVVLWSDGNYAESEKVYRQLVDVERRVLGPDHPQTLGSMGNLANALQAQWHLAEAEQLDREVLASYQRVLGPEHQNTTRMMRRLADVLDNEGHENEAEKIYRQVLEIRMRTLGSDHPDTLQARTNLALLLVEQGHLKEAEGMQRQTLATSLRVTGPENPQTLWFESALAETLLKEGESIEAEKYAGDAFAIERRTLAPIHPEKMYTLLRLGMAMTYRQRCTRAAGLFREMIEQSGHQAPLDNRPSVWYSFACVATTANDPDDAILYLREAVKRGYRDANALASDDDFRSLRTNPGFQQIVAQLRQSPIAQIH